VAHKLRGGGTQIRNKITGTKSEITLPKPRITGKIYLSKHRGGVEKCGDMNDFTNKFIEAMNDAGIPPSNPSSISGEDKLLSYHIVGDKRGQKKGFYRLAIDPQSDFAYGYFGDYRVGDAHHWHVKTDRKVTKQERDEIEARMAAHRAKVEQEEKDRHEACARDAQDFTLFLNSATTHPYLTKKGIGPHGVLISGEDLIIPMSDQNKVWSYQTIKPDGEKLFYGGQAGARARGLWFKIPGDDTICLAEGFATGASIKEATGHTVYVCFNAGNLIACAKPIRAMHPDAKIIICADNDHFKKDKDGNVIQTGIKKAIIAATDIDAYITYPNTNDLLKGDDKTDFNDLHVIMGLGVVKNRIEAFCKKPTEIRLDHINGSFDEAIAGGVVYPTSHTPRPNSDWRSFLQLKKDGSIVERSVTNLLLIMKNDEHLAGVFKYNSFAKNIIMSRCPPWENEQTFKVRQIYDYDYIRLESYLETTDGLKTGREKCADAILSTAQLPCNTFNPATDYFESLQWDGVQRLNTWLKDYVSNGKQSDEYIKVVGRKFVCGLAARAMKPGVKFDTMIILEGKQNGGKSRLANALATINGAEYFLDDFRDIDNKDSLMKIQGKLVVEFPEITTMRRTEVNELKGFLSRQTDSFRPPYARNTIEAPRQCVFIGTVNPEGEYLRDVTGNRRYWPISCRDKIDLDTIKELMPQLHAEAAFLVKNGEQLWLNEHEYDLATSQQEERVVVDAWYTKIFELVQYREWISTEEILEAIGIPLDRRSSLDIARVTKIMVTIGWTRNRKRVGPNQMRGWDKPASTDSIEEELPL
jgi:putative DNA primase/helicase